MTDLTTLTVDELSRRYRELRSAVRILQNRRRYGLDTTRELHALDQLVGVRGPETWDPAISGYRHPPYSSAMPPALVTLLPEWEGKELP
jgi:hypothetical protein